MNAEEAMEAGVGEAMEEGVGEAMEEEAQGGGPLLLSLGGAGIPTGGESSPR